MLALSPSLSLLAAAGLAAARTLNITALTGHKGQSALECWSMHPPFTESGQEGTAGALTMQLGNLANASYSILPPQFNAGLHNAPNVQYVVFLSGLAHISLPHGNDSAFVLGGANGFLFAADTAAVSKDGHLTVYPSDEPTRALQIPTANGRVPPHKVIHAGPCTSADA
ncbi:hypothetical protein AURDEDRAFT_188330 [Auricularia subglabra TFB-10046 SS5]|nr:hypothetical protein AURDEDRAFT_188330 [Auricularia subglabra TFB-10046 SS5]